MKRYRIPPGEEVKLARCDPRDTAYFADGKEESRKELSDIVFRLDDLQKRLFAEHRQGLLIVLQAMDTGGKDGTIRHVFGALNPQGVRVAAFGTPSGNELDRDYLWRVHQQVPRRGEIVIFNRSHYEDVLVARVKKLVPPAVWRRRFAHINDFERMLTDEGTTIVKFFLHISKKEQAERLTARLERPEKNWKFDRADLTERRRWEKYLSAYETVLTRTSTEKAPWYVIPADRKWYRNLMVGRITLAIMERMDPRFPPPAEEPGDIVIE